MSDPRKKHAGRYELKRGQECAREGCTRWARGDDFCSRRCSELAAGIRTQEQDLENRRIRDRIRRQEDEPTILVDNTHVNRPRHHGPSVRPRKGFTSGR